MFFILYKVYDSKSKEKNKKSKEKNKKNKEKIKKNKEKKIFFFKKFC